MSSEQKAALVKQIADLIADAGDICYEFRRPSVDDEEREYYESAVKAGPTVYMHIKLEMDMPPALSNAIGEDQIVSEAPYQITITPRP